MARESRLSLAVVRAGYCGDSCHENRVTETDLEAEHSLYPASERLSKSRRCRQRPPNERMSFPMLLFDEPSRTLPGRTVEGLYNQALICCEPAERPPGLDCQEFFH
jgi:hypothetical protein